MLTTGARDVERQSGEFVTVGSTAGSEVMTNTWLGNRTEALMFESLNVSLNV